MLWYNPGEIEKMEIIENAHTQKNEADDDEGKTEQIREGGQGTKKEAKNLIWCV